MRKWLEIALFLLRPAPVAVREATYGQRFTGYTPTAPDPSE